MGAAQTREVVNSPPVQTPQLKITFQPILDQFETIEQVQDALRKAGLESSQLVVGIDFTKSNEWTGKNTFGGRCLHAIGEDMNLYERALYVIARTLSAFDDDEMIPCYGFGDLTTHDTGVFSFFPEDKPVYGFDNALQRYRQIAPHVQLSGPTSFAPLIHQAIAQVINSGMQYHILLILADGQVTPTCLEATKQAILTASYFPMSIVLIGIGDGPWDYMKTFDDQLPARRFDNFQFVDFCRVMNQASVYIDSEERQNAHFALHALMEIPDQFRFIQQLRLSNSDISWYSPPTPILYPVPSNVLFADSIGL